ncbi:carbohydrate deacetylase [Psychromonas marina]|uniref:Carbohydrate deacetylase n=1 Tax=Psychromonas marina TaxID=88364 RepID=A0ABQ6DYH5_9GAMM|nr:carbohydrate deacetylase [Psychromonas marina]GLS90202.1 carbohydrate deacetylase [Psychromonas marina]
MKLIFNADDFGLSESVNNGIVQCFKAGVVKSTTVMMNQPGVKNAADIYQQGLIPEVGLHFTVTAGKPLSPAHQVPSLIDDNGDFFGRAALMQKQDINQDHVYNELMAQYQAAIAAGFEINHLDSHHFAGVYPPLKEAFIRFANDINLPVRRIDNIVAGQTGLKVATPDAFDMRFFDQGVSLAQLKTLLLSYQKTMPDGILELMCHPSTEDNADLIGLTGYIETRNIERDILTSNELCQWLKAQNIECIGFDEVTS